MEDSTTMIEKVPEPFTNMAVSLSGGGYRATTFHLGTLAYLDYRTHNGKSLLENVTILSTISGGTLTGVMYALKLAQGKTFTDCFSKLYDLLSKNRLVDHALKKLNKPRSWKNKYKTRDVINAFSEVYNEEFFEEATFATLQNGQKTHLQDVIFGSSELTTGIQFRLQEGPDGGLFGNGNLNIPSAAAAEIRLADAAAASSCFPGGFEPLIMPNDFGNGPDSIVDNSWAEKAGNKSYQPTALMDGGIIDNQGIEGVQRAENRRDKDGPFVGTFIFSDVSSRGIQPYEVPRLNSTGFANHMTLSRINWLAIIAIILSVLLLYRGLPPWGDILSTIALTLSALWLLAFFLVRRSLSSTIFQMFGDEQSPELLSHLKILTRTPLPILIYLVKFRVTSVMKIVSDIFMRRIRALQIDALFGSSEWRYRIRANYIYSLHKKADTFPGEMRSVIESANSMPTTLWFSGADVDDGRLDKLIACGQFTICSNLIKYTESLCDDNGQSSVWSRLDSAQQQSILTLQSQMKDDWARFLEDPYWLLTEYKNKSLQD